MSEARPSADLRTALQEAEARNSEHEALLGAIGRELNNALVPVLLGIERLRPLLAAGDVARARQALATLETAAGGFARRARLLDMLGIRSAIAPNVQMLPAGALLRAAADRSQDIARRAGSPILVEAPPALHGPAEPDALALILDEIIVNALRHAPGRPLRLSAAALGQGRVRLSVQDEGPGFAAATLASLFAPRRHNETPFEPGLGIALSIAQRLAGAMGATLGAENRPAGAQPGTPPGALPEMPPQAPTEAPPAAPHAGAPGPAAHPAPPTPGAAHEAAGPLNGSLPSAAPAMPAGPGPLPPPPTLPPTVPHTAAPDDAPPQRSGAHVFVILGADHFPRAKR